MSVGDVLGYQCDECGSPNIRFSRPGDQGLYEGDTLVCKDCGAGGNEQSFMPRPDEAIEALDETPTVLTTQQWKWPPTPGPYVNEGCYAVTSRSSGQLLVANRNNPLTRPTERDSNVAFAAIAMQHHDNLVGVVAMLCRGIEWQLDNRPEYTTQADNEALAEARALLAQIAKDSQRRNT